MTGAVEMCDACWRRAVAEIDNAQAIDEYADAPPPPAPPACRHCTLELDRYATGYGKWVLLDPLGYPPTSVPPSVRWLIRGDGTAARVTGRVPSEVTECRILHAAVCPNQGEALDYPPMLRVLRQYNADTAAVKKFAKISTAAELQEGHEEIG
jgi:hypothetical protein